MCREPLLRWLMALAPGVLFGCPAESGRRPPDTTDTRDPGDVAADVDAEDDVAADGDTTAEEILVPEGPIASLTPRLRLRTGAVLADDLAAALELPRESVCRELGRYDCATEVHAIALGGVEPYELNLHNPLPIAPVTAPIAVDRIALGARRERVDFEAMGQGLFAPLAVLDGAPTQATLDDIGRALFRRILRRDATADELAETSAVYAELAAEGGDATTRDFAILACFAVATHVEAILY